MLRILLIPAAVIVLVSPPALAQDWAPFPSLEDGFRANFPGQPEVEAITYSTEYRATLPGRIYRAADALGRYSTTVVDYRGVERIHSERAARCLRARGANQLDGDACQNDFRVDVAGAIDHAAWNFLRRDGVTVTQFGLYFVDQVSGRQLQITNRDRSRTYVGIHQHAGRLYIHEATVADGLPEPLLFMQSLAWLDEKGLAIRYRTLYTEGYGDWMFPRAAPPHSLRDLNTAIERPPRPPQ